MQSGKASSIHLAATATPSETLDESIKPSSTEGKLGSTSAGVLQQRTAHPKGVQLASAEITVLGKSAVGLGQRNDRFNWNYGALEWQAFLDIVNSVATGKPVTQPVRMTYYLEADRSALGPAAAKVMERAGLDDFTLRANLTVRPPTAQELSDSDSAWKVKSGNVLLAADYLKGGHLPTAHPNSNIVTWATSTEYEEGKGFSQVHNAFTQVITRTPGHGKEFEAGNQRFSLAGTGYLFLIPDKYVPGAAGTWTTAASAVAGYVPTGAKPLSTPLGGAVRLNELRELAGQFERSLVNPVRDGRSMEVLTRTRLLAQVNDRHNQGLLGLQFEGNVSVNLKSDGSNMVEVFGPDGKPVATVPYDKLMAALQPYYEAARQFSDRAAVIEPLITGLGVRAGVAGSSAWVKNFVRVFRPGRPPTENIAVVRDVIRSGEGSWSDVAAVVRGWPKLAEGMGGWKVLAKEVGGWNELAKEVGSWSKLSKHVGGVGKLASAMGGLRALASVAGETVLVALITESAARSFSAIDGSLKLSKLDISKPDDAEQALQHIDALIDNPLSAMPRPMESALIDTPDPTENPRRLLEQLRQQILFIHPQLVPPNQDAIVVDQIRVLDARPVRRYVGAEVAATGLALQGALWQGRTTADAGIFWLQGVNNNYVLRSADRKLIDNEDSAVHRARELIRHGAITDLRPLDLRYVAPQAGSQATADNTKSVGGIAVVGPASVLGRISIPAGRDATVMWGHSASGELRFWLRGSENNYVLKDRDGSFVTNGVDAMRRAEELIRYSATDLKE
jgi:hypothetical protein